MAVRSPRNLTRARTRASRAQRNEPRLPHERDESADSQAPVRDEPTGHQAYKDLERGLVDTDRGPVMEDLYEAVEPEPAQPEPAQPLHRDRGPR